MIIGNSAAGLNALETFRKYQPHAPLTLISSEPGPAYSRVLLPYYLRSRIPYQNMFIRDAAYYRRLSVRTMFGETVTGLDDENRELKLASGNHVPYDQLLIACGALPVMPPIPGLPGPGVHHLWTLTDAEHLAPYFQVGKKVLILGSGFVSLQAAWSAVQRGMEVSVYELMPQIMPRILDDQAAGLLQRKIIQYGVDLRLNINTERVQRQQDGKITVFAREQEPLTVDLVIVGTGVRPNTGFLLNSRLATDLGILVDEKMATNLPGIYAAGDVAQGPTAFGDRHAIHAFWPTAVEEGKVAGANMAGRALSYPGSLNMNVTQMFGLTVASMGDFCSPDNQVLRQEIDLEQGKYLKIFGRAGVPVGALAVGGTELMAEFGILRALIRNRQIYQPLPLKYQSLRGPLDGQEGTCLGTAPLREIISREGLSCGS